MKSALKIVGVLFAIFAAIAIVTVTPLVGEVATLHTKAADGSWKKTPLWIVDAETGSYLRTASADVGWVARVRATRQVRLERSESLGDVQLFEEPEMREAVNALMADKYGWADDLATMSDGHRDPLLIFRVEDSATARAE